MKWHSQQIISIFSVQGRGSSHRAILGILASSIGVNSNTSCHSHGVPTGHGRGVGSAVTVAKRWVSRGRAEMRPVINHVWIDGGKIRHSVVLAVHPRGTIGSGGGSGSQAWCEATDSGIGHYSGPRQGTVQVCSSDGAMMAMVVEGVGGRAKDFVHGF